MQPSGRHSRWTARWHGPRFPAQGPAGTARTLGIREGGGRGRSRESTARETLAQGAFQQWWPQPRPARGTEAQPSERPARPHLLEPRNLPPTGGTLPLSTRGGVSGRAETRRYPLSPRILGYLLPPLAHAAWALQLRPPDGLARSGRPALQSPARRGTEVRRWERLEPGRPAPERGASSRPERTNEPRPPSSAPDSQRLSRRRGGAAHASHRLPAFSISPFSP